MFALSHGDFHTSKASRCTCVERLDDLERDFAAGVYLSEAPPRFMFGVV